VWAVADRRYSFDYTADEDAPDGVGVTRHKRLVELVGQKKPGVTLLSAPFKIILECQFADLGM
jgi:hypothetical protein